MPVRLVCKCGWRSEPYPDGTMFAGPAGQLMCPECTKYKRNKNIEVYGDVHSEPIKSLDERIGFEKSKPDKYLTVTLKAGLNVYICHKATTYELEHEPHFEDFIEKELRYQVKTFLEQMMIDHFMTKVAMPEGNVYVTPNIPENKIVVIMHPARYANILKEKAK